MQIYITDKTGRKFWNTNVSADWATGERNNQSKRLASIKRMPSFAAKLGIDASSAHVVEELELYEIPMTDDELLAELTK